MHIARIVLLSGLLVAAGLTQINGNRDSATQDVERPTKPVARPAAAAPPAKAPRQSARSQRQEFLELWGRAYFPGRMGDIMIVPRDGDVITRPEPEVPFMHGSPWSYDTEIPILFVGPAVRAGIQTIAAKQQDVAPTLAHAVGFKMPRTASGMVLPIFRLNFERPRAVMLIVLDGMRRDYFDTYRTEMPTLSRLRRSGAWFARARTNYLPSNTGTGHATIATGADPRIHGITGNNLYDRVNDKRQDAMARWTPRDLMALTLADVWQLETRGRAIVIAQGSSEPSATALAGHGACQINGFRIRHAGYDVTTGKWNTNPECFTLPEYLQAADARTLWPPDGRWMGHKIDSPSGVRRSGLFPRFEADAMEAMLQQEPIGEDEVPDLILLNFKGADYVGHKHGPASTELRVTLAEMDKHIARFVAALEKRVGSNYVLAFTADHGMPGEPAAPRRRLLNAQVTDLLHDRFDRDKKLVSYYEPENSQIFVDLERLQTTGTTVSAIARFLEAQPFVFAAFTEDEIRRAAAALR